MREPDAHRVLEAQVLGEPLGAVHRPVAAAGATERNHEVREPAPLIILHAGLNERKRMGEKVVRALLCLQVLDHRRIRRGFRIRGDLRGASAARDGCTRRHVALTLPVAEHKQVHQHGSNDQGERA